MVQCKCRLSSVIVIPKQTFQQVGTKCLRFCISKISSNKHRRLFHKQAEKKTTIEAADAPKDGTINFILTSLSGGSHCSKI